ncbi:MAG TPA: helix-turn-helix transcriptional regulator [Rectinemataceae bacterium]|nr:helix-turn-helix transcriptional regulator [Rectinemataceae bacterium]
MSSKLRASGILFAAVFSLGYLLNVALGLERGRSPWWIFFNITQLSLLASIALFGLSAIFASLRWIQPAVFLALGPVAVIQNYEDIYGLGFFIMGGLLLERAGFFQRHRFLKVMGFISYLLAIEIAAAVVSRQPMTKAVGPTFFITAFGVFLWFLYKDRLVVSLKEPKARVSLSARGLTHAERAYSLAMIEGKSVKEIAFDYEVSESTVRNTIARACKKLAVEDSTGLAVLAATHEIVV